MIEQFLAAALADKSVQFGIAVVFAVIVMFIVGVVADAVRKDARLSKYAHAFNVLRDKAADYIITIRYGNIDLGNYNGIDYNEKAVILSEKFGRTIDPRMAFVYDRLDEEVAKFGLNIESEDVLALAERKYNELRYGNNGLVLNPADVPAVIAAVAQSDKESARAAAQQERRYREQRERESLARKDIAESAKASVEE